MHRVRCVFERRHRADQNHILMIDRLISWTVQRLLPNAELSKALQNAEKAAHQRCPGVHLPRCNPAGSAGGRRPWRLRAGWSRGAASQGLKTLAGRPGGQIGPGLLGQVPHDSSRRSIRLQVLWLRRARHQDSRLPEGPAARQDLEQDCQELRRAYRIKTARKWPGSHVFNLSFHGNSIACCMATVNWHPLAAAVGHMGTWRSQTQQIATLDSTGVVAPCQAHSMAHHMP